MKTTVHQKALSKYERNYKKIHDIVCNFSQDGIYLFNLINNSKIQKVTSISQKHWKFKE